MTMLRLDKLLSDTGERTRSEARSLIRAGRVSVDGRVVTKPEEKFDGEAAALYIDGARVGYARFRYLMLNKPAGVLSASRDREAPTVMDLLPEALRRQGLFPVGRLDKDTTGLLLLTNDGDFAHRITSPRSRIPKRYRALVSRPPTGADAAAFEAGLVLGDGSLCLPARLEAAPDSECAVLATVFEGKYHQVKRMLAARGMKVLSLERLSVGGLALDPEILPGDYRELTENQKSDLFRF